MKQKKPTAADIAAYNHGFCYCLANARRRSINALDLQKEARWFYPGEGYTAEGRRGYFCSGYYVALDEINTGKLTAADLGPSANEPEKGEPRPC